MREMQVLSSLLGLLCALALLCLIGLLGFVYLRDLIFYGEMPSLLWHVGLLITLIGTLIIKNMSAHSGVDK